jgi:hypothetical protein
MALWQTHDVTVLSINAGSSSIRFAVYGGGEPPAKLLDGKIERIGLDGTTLIVNDPSAKQWLPRIINPQPPFSWTGSKHSPSSPR